MREAHNGGGMDTPLKRLRVRQGLTLKVVSKASGIDVGNLSRIERGLQITSLNNAKKLSKFFGGEVSEIEILFPFN